MVVVNLIGGLGNQMFQYAAGRALSLRRDTSLKHDVSDFEGYRLHQGFELHRVFACQVELASHAEVHALLGWRSGQRMMSLLKRRQLAWLRGSRFVVEPHFRYWSGIKDVPGDCYLAGYWQSERYFADVTENVHNDFTFKNPLSGRNLELSGQIAACNAVSLHIRRGDYVTNVKTSGLLGACSLDYYRDAIAYMVGRVESPRFFVFSDDIEWVKAHLNLDVPCTYIDHNRGADSYRDMQLMSLCRHHIIANSSFSWWGAWLNPCADKIVIAPKRWFASTLNSEDLIPQAWKRF